MKKFLIYFLLITLLLGTGSCKKYLDEKPNDKLHIPSTLADFQALIDYYPTINNNDPSSGEISADDYYLFDADYNAIAQDNFKRMYIWDKDNLFPLASNEWFTTYRPVFTSNTILDNFGQVALTPANLNDYNNVKGQALFIRGKAFLKATGIWTAQYNPTSATTQLGIPLRLGAEFNKQSVRSTLGETYAQIISDLKLAANLLPKIPVHVERASKPAAFALLARTYLLIGNYKIAGLYADSCLQLKSDLIDFNTLSTTASYPFAKFNKEVIQESMMITSVPLNNARARIDTNLYNSYSSNDLRKLLYFKTSTNNSHVFKGSYEAAATLFGGIATDEMYLTRAECSVRTGNIDGALNDLNLLLINRYKKGNYAPFANRDPAILLQQIIIERRKELLMRGLRWGDIKRYNQEGQNISLTRKLNGQIYTLPPNDLKFALPIPDDIIQLTGMSQNPR